MIDLKQRYDASTVAVMRQALNEVVTNRRFLVRKSVTPLEVAEHILQQAASGERDFNRLKSSAFEKLSTGCQKRGRERSSRGSAMGGYNDANTTDELTEKKITQRSQYAHPLVLLRQTGDLHRDESND